MNKALKIIVAPLLLSGIASASTISGVANEYITSFSGSIDPIDIVLNGVSVNTGSITYTLDSSRPSAQQQWSLDFGHMTQSYAVDVLLSAPLLDDLGGSPQRMHLSVSGPITGFPSDALSNGDNVLNLGFDHLTAYGTFEPDQLFSGWTYSNCQTGSFKNLILNININIHDIIIGLPKNTPPTQPTAVGATDAKLTSPLGEVYALTGNGTASLSPSPVPVPGSLWLFGSGLIGLTGLARKRKAY